MSEVFDLKPRSLKGKKTRKLRRQGIIPGAISRYKKETLLVEAPVSEVRKFMNYPKTKVFKVKVGDEEYNVVLTEVLIDPIKEEVLSFNLTEITPKSTISVEVPIELVGEAPAVKKGLGVLVITKPYIKLVVNSENIVDIVKVDISKLETVGDAVLVSDVIGQLPEGVKLASYNELNDALVTVVPFQKTLEEEQQEAAEAEGVEAAVQATEGEPGETQTETQTAGESASEAA